MRTLLVLLTLFAVAAAPFAAAAEKSPLGESLKDIDVADHWIYDDWPRAVAQAKQTGKPLLVVLRCVPCPPGKTLDEAVMQPDKDLAELEKKFVCVRIIQTNQLDLDLFQYDYDMSWAAMFLNADQTIYGRYGSRDASGPQSDGLLSVAAFRKAAERVLALHADYPKNKTALAAKTGTKSAYAAANQIPGLTDRPAVATERRQCVHCHMLKEFDLRAKWEAGKLSAADLFVYPLPQTIGLTTAVSDGLQVTAVRSGSVAATAGIATDDNLVSINGQPPRFAGRHSIGSHTAEQWPLGGDAKARRPDAGKKIVVSGDWKRSDIAWRASSWLGLQGTEIGAAFCRGEAGQRHRGRPSGTCREEHLRPRRARAKTAGLRQNDVIIAVDGQSAEMDESEFLVDLR
jgi:hypothetical protein